MQTIINMLAHELRQPESYVSNVVKLLDEGNTATGKSCTARWTTR